MCYMIEDWRPTASLETLKQREKILRTIREFFYARDVLEVETPCMAHAPVTDPYLHSFVVDDQYYLQTSPEYAMKRLLAAGSGSIFQMGKAFRAEELGRFHSAEFTMLEWYRVGFDHHHLMDEMEQLLKIILKDKPCVRYSYAAIFEKYLAINPHRSSLEELQQLLLAQLDNKISIDMLDDRDICLQFLMSDIIEPKLATAGIVFIYDYPVTQAALAKIRHDDPPVAERFEVYVDGIELANGFHELSDEKEQRARFEKDLAKRKALGYPVVPIDEKLLAALEAGLPACAGVALGVDRLVMIALNKQAISDVMVI